MPDIRHDAIDWCQRGYYPIPIPYREKGPKLENWQNLHLTAADVPLFFNGAPQNIGVLLGEPYGNCDIDLDNATAAVAFPLFAPETGLIFGHKSKPRSHYFYRVDPPSRSVQYKDPLDNIVLLEFRCLKVDGSTGLQTVVPPSVHPSGEPIEFCRDCNREPGNVDAGELRRAVRWTAAVALLARHWPPAQGGRHEAFLALAGALAYAKWGLNETTQLVCGLYQTLWPGSADLTAAAREVESTFQRHDDGHEVTGLPQLMKLVSPVVVKEIAKWLELRREPKEKTASILSLTSLPSVWELQAEVSWLVEEMFSEGSVNLITGDSGDGKSTLALALAGAVVHGTGFLGRRTLERHVLYVDRENPLYTVKERLLRLHIRPTDRLHIWGLWNEQHPEGPASPSILAFVKQYHPLIIFDPLVAFHEGDEKDATETRRHMSLYRTLAAAGATVIILHHTGKSEGAKEYRGSSDIKAAADIGFLLERADGSVAGSELAGMRLMPFKSRLVAVKPIRFDYAGGAFLPTEGPVKSADELIHDGLRLNPGCTQKELIDWASQRGISWRKVKELLERMVLDGRAVIRRGGRNTIRYYLPDTGPQLVI